MECLEGGQLKKKMEEVFQQGHKFSEDEASIIIKGIAEGIAYMHKNDTIHRDLKPGNRLCFLMTGNEGNCCIRKYSLQKQRSS